jgi:hypothetical protein
MICSRLLPFWITDDCIKVDSNQQHVQFIFMQKVEHSNQSSSIIRYIFPGLERILSKVNFGTYCAADEKVD